LGIGSERAFGMILDDGAVCGDGFVPCIHFLGELP
jgi:hypothetical protein